MMDPLARPHRTGVHHRFALAAALLCLLLPVTAAASSDSETRDPKAVEIAQKALDGMGGADAWAASRHLVFDFFDFRRHAWDRETGRHRLEGATREGQNYVVLHNVNSRTGQVFLDGELLAGDAAAEWLERAYGAWINDVYWLVMPYKVLDPGVHLAYEGRETVDGTELEKIRLTFGEVGLTPGDTYWAWFDPESGLMSRWAYHLESWEADREPTAWDWTDWREYGDIMLAGTRVQLGEGGTSRDLTPIGVFDDLPDAVYTSPEPVPFTLPEP
ncbi:MAG: hypothetical protein AAGN46_00305 [Acidobacteriota bacterium]